MPRAASIDLSSPVPAARSWLGAVGRHSSRPGRSAAAISLVDVVGAVAFAAGLALTVARLDRDFAALWAPAALLLAGAFLRGIAGPWAAQAAARHGARVKRSVRRETMAAYLAPRLAGSSSTGEALAVVTDAVEALDGWYARFEPALRAARLSPLLVIAAMAAASPVSAGILLASFAPFMATMALSGGAAAAAARRQFDALARLSERFADRVRALPAILAFGGEARGAADVAQASDALAERTLAVLRIAFVSSAGLEFFAALSVALVAVYCGFSLLHLLPFRPPERLDLARAVFVLALAPEAYLPMRRLAAAYHHKETAEAAAQAVIDAQAGARRALPGLDLAAAPALSFKAVRFVYPGQARPVLDAFDLTVRAGECVAFMGPSGCGKSTVLRLALGQLAADEGCVSLDGVPLPPQRAAWVGQSPVVTPGSLAENIVLGRLNATADELAAAAVQAGLSPAWLDRPIDERGGGLSGGERRRLGLARAFLAQASMVLLDEPTADLDAASEIQLLPAIATLARGRTTLIATHSPRVAALADRIVVMPA